MAEFEKSVKKQASSKSLRFIASPAAKKEEMRRILVGVRLEERLVKVMKGLAELNDCTLGQLVEEVFMHAMDGNSAFARAENRKLTPEMKQQIVSLKQVYGVDYSLEELNARCVRKSRTAKAVS